MHVPFTRIAATPDGGSRFVDDVVGLEGGDFAPPAPPLGLGPVAGSRSMRFIGVPPGWDSPPHPAPARKLVMMIQGVVEATTTNGEVRRFRPGAAVLLEDTTGVGHRTRVVGDEPWLAIVVVLT
jgi:quercetin dioxygenase-like cupin family protein